MPARVAILLSECGIVDLREVVNYELDDAERGYFNIKRDITLLHKSTL